MTCQLQDGHRLWGGERDAEGHRTYNVTLTVLADATDGPFNVMRTPGLPVAGAFWNIKSDVDPWAFCLPNVKVYQQGRPEEPSYVWFLDFQFSTKPPQRQRCQDNPIEDPLLEPPDISGVYSRYTEEATHDRFGVPILTSSWEPIRGPQVEFDANRAMIKIVQNVASSYQGISLPYLMVDTVNDRPVWGFPARCVKLSSAPWERKFWGQCQVYYRRTLEFDIDRNTFDRSILDEGTKALHGEWDRATGEWTLIQINGEDPNPYDPNHFDQFTDKNGNPCRVILNGYGLPALSVASVRQPANLFGQPFGMSPTYQRGDVVDFEGNVWVAIRTNCNSRPVVGSRDWVKLTGVIYETFAGTPPYNVGDILRETAMGALGPGGLDLNAAVEHVHVFTQFHGGVVFPIDKVVDLGLTVASGGNALNNKGLWIGVQGPRNTYSPIGNAGAYDGKPTDPGTIVVSEYGESNFFLLGIPAVLN